MEDVPTKRKAKIVQIVSDDEEEDSIPAQSGIVPESIIGSQPTLQQVTKLQPTDGFSLTQFFQQTQMSGLSTPSAEKLAAQSQSGGTGLTQFFTSTALLDEEETPKDDVHTRMERLRQKAGQGVMSLGNESIGFQGETSVPAPLPPLFSPVASDHEEISPIRRRILKKRRHNQKENVETLPSETSEEFIKAKREFVDEQAEESEDDYAAWGSGDESENENMDGVVEGLIDDDTK